MKTEVRERPILMRGEMVRAILDGRKTQTRRPVKPQPANITPDLAEVLPEAWDSGFIDVKCPYGKPGDRLWVRETFAEVHPIAVTPGRFTKRLHAGISGPPEVDYLTIYRADGERPAVYYVPEYPFRSLVPTSESLGPRETTWTPSIHMPRLACRLVLEITDVRVERLQDISEEDAKAEGVRGFVEDGCWVYEDYCLGAGTWNMSAKGSFASLWQSIHGGESWDANPWLWVIAFNRLTPPTNTADPAKAEATK